MQSETDTQRRGDTLATLETEKHRVEMAEEGGQCGACQDERAGVQRMGNQYRQQSFQHVAEQRQCGGLFTADARYIGCTRIARALRARIRQPHQFADDDGGGDRAEQVSARYQQVVDVHD